MKHRPIPDITDSVWCRLWEKIRINEKDRCWPWLGRIIRDGYGVIDITIDGRYTQVFTASRIVYAAVYKVDPGQLNVCHSCDNRWCCNYNHLFLGTTKENVDDCIRKGRNSRGVRHSEACKASALRGERHPAARLTEDGVRYIRNSYPGVKQVQIASHLGVSQSTVCLVLSGKIWGHVQ